MFILRIRVLTLRPRLGRRGQQLWVSTPWLVRALSLFSFVRDVHVDASSKYVFISERRWWFSVRTRVIRFGDIARITYSFRAIPTSWNRWALQTEDTVELFDVGLELAPSGEVVPFTRFVGEGEAGSLVATLFGDDIVDASGTQEDESRLFVKELRRLLGKDVAVHESELLQPVVPQWTCGACGRQVPPKPKCLYCGGEASPS